MKYFKIKTHVFLIMVLILLFSQNRDTLGDVNNDGLIDILDAVRTVSIIIGDIDPTEYELWASDVNVDNDVTIQDIVVLVGVILENQCPEEEYSPCSDNLANCCLDSTNHNFIFEIDTLGVAGSILRDVAIVNENEYWVVGALSIEDSTYLYPGHTNYNAAHWNGSEWEFIQIVTTATLYSIYYFSDNDIWVTTYGFPIHWDGNEWTLYQLQDMGLSVSVGFGIWGTSSSNLYFVGSGGSIVHYDGSNFVQMESGTDIRLEDIHGTPDGEHIFVTGYNDSGESIVLELHAGAWQTIYSDDNYWPDSDTTGAVFGTYVYQDTVYFTRKGGLWKYNYLTEESTVIPGEECGFLEHDYEQIIVAGLNDILAKSGGYSLLHYNGNTWYTDVSVNDHFGWYGLTSDSFDFHNDLLIMVGCYNCWYGQGVVIRGYRE